MLRRGFSWPIVEPTRICLSPRREQRASLDRRGGAGVVVAGCEFVVEAESEKKLKKGGSPIFHQDTKTIVADHQQLKSAIGAAAISSTHSLSDHSLVFLLPASWNQVQPPSCWSGSIVSPPAARTAYGFARRASLLLPKNDSAPPMWHCQSQSARLGSRIHTAVAARSGISIRISPRGLCQKIQSSNWRLLKLYDPRFLN